MELVTYKKYNERERAEFIAGLLHDNGIQVEITEDRDSLDSLYGGNSQARNYYLKLQQTDFANADSILKSLSEQELATVDKDHYLYSFSDEELFDVLAKPDEWNEFDYQLSRKILRERGKEINDDTIKLLRKQRINDLSKPDEGHRRWMYA